MHTDGFEKIMCDESVGGEKLSEPGCNAMKGLMIITKYVPGSGISRAEHDIIYSVDVNVLVEAGITEEDAIELRAQNWMIDEDSYCMACYV